MQLKHGDLARHVEQGLLPAYLIAGDETLLVEEACDLVIAAARTQGFTERSVHFADGNFNWAEIIHDSASISLFAERKILDVRVRSGKFGDASEVIRSWTASADGETVLLIRCGRLDKNQRKSAWFKAIEAIGAVVLIWDMGPAELPRWLHGRLRDQGLQVEADAVAYLGERVEGNLLAADQEIRKLALLEIEQPITLPTMIATLEDVSRFTPFDVINAAMSGDAKRTRHILHALRAEGASQMGLLMALIGQLREQSPQRLPPQSQEALKQFRKRIRDSAPVLAECAVVDQQIRGQLPGDAWRSLEKLLLRMSGMRQIKLASEDAQAVG